MKLHQLLAIEKGEKTRSNRAVSDLHKASQKPALYHGRHSTYRPRDEENGEQQPEKVQLVQLRADDVLKGVRDAMSRIFDLTAARDKANQEAKISVVVDGITVLLDAPVTFLIYMEKSLDDIETQLREMPVLPSTLQWLWDDNTNTFVTAPALSYKSAKIDKVVTMAPATTEHPAQVQIRPADVQVGTWTTVQSSGCLTAKRKEEILERVIKLKEAVKLAREEANGVEVQDVQYGKAVFDYCFGA